MQTYTSNFFEATEHDINFMELWIADFCKINPEVSLVVAVDLMIKERLTDMLKTTE